jgi:hypothetical protein
MNSAYRSSCVFTDSSTRAWIVTVFGCLGGALMIAMLSFYSSLAVLYYGLSYNSVAAPPPRGQNTGCGFLQPEAGVTPEARRDRAAIFAARWGRSRPSECFGRVPIPAFFCCICSFLHGLILAGSES